jgi:DNA (cytosine-5)-methyltransferase 1
MITFGSLFAGIGGFDLGLERAGMVCKWQVEIDDYANRVLEKHWPSVERYRDIRTFPEKCQSPWLGGGWRDKYAVDVICGGFPCQDISYAGRGAGLDGERSGLFFEAIRVVRELQPRAVVLENVAALLTRGLDRVLGTLAEIGYDAEWHCIPAAAVGAPHIRDRVFVLAYASRELLHRSWIRPTKTRGGEPAISGEVLADATEQRWRQRHANGSGCNERNETGQECGLGSGCAGVANADCKGLEKREGQDSEGSGENGGAKPSRSELWAVEPDVGRVAHGVPKRVDRLRGLGNAIVPQVAEYVGKMVGDRLAKDKN